MRVPAMVIASAVILVGAFAFYQVALKDKIQLASANCTKEDCAVSHTVAKCANNCSTFGACSVDKNLARASGDELNLYRTEKDTDGQTFSDWKAPNFTLMSTGGEEVSLSDFRGNPVALIMFATHCNHCVDTVPILTELMKRYRDTNLVVLPVVVNARSEKNVRSWAKATGADFPLLVSKDKQVAAAYNTRLVPATFLIDANGYVKRKLVTFQDRKTLDLALGELLGAGAGRGSK